jgi:preprotein translocase subunit SecA
MVVYREQMVQRGHAFAIIDEVDSILIDEARTPLIISGSGEESSELYTKADRFVRTLSKFVIKELDDKVDNDDVAEDYIVDEKAKSAVLTRNGIAKAEAYFGVENISDPENADLMRFITQSLRAHGIMHIDEDYVVKDGEVVIVDSFTGRLMPGRRYNGGLHQAIEAKEGVQVEKESKTLATITFQNFFRLYKKLSGMTGTALTEEEEFREIYYLDVVEIPTNKPMIRIDHNDSVYRTLRGKYNAILEQIRECQAKGQPVLVGTVTIERSEFLSQLLKKNGIRHTVLNAKHHEREAEIVAQAGKEGAVTISTNMAGRGTDIMLGGNPEFMAKHEMRRRGIPEELITASTGTAYTENPEILEARALFAELFEKYKAEIAPEAARVRAAGGLFILGTERHESRRIDNQLRGRSGRQGDPGESRFFLSLEDDLMRLFGVDRVADTVARLGMDENTPIEASIISGSIRSAQQKVESRNFNYRKNVLTYDDVMNQQREIIYGQRQQVLNGDDIRPLLESMIEQFVSETVATYMPSHDPATWDLEGLKTSLNGYLTGPDDPYFQEEHTPDEVTECLTTRALDLYHGKDELFPDGAMREVERVILLRNVDSQWTDHIDAMDDLKETVGLNAYANRSPISEYRIIGGEMFEEMTNTIRERTVRMLLTVRPQSQPMRRVQVVNPTMAGGAGGKPSAPPPPKKPTVRGTKVGPNDPCPCGSGRKYKKCCGLGAPTGAK